MKFKKALSGVLALSMFIPNFNISTMANSDISERYQTLEGEYIAIDKSTEGELHEIEIFGNTVQDEDNLEDIQSVGDLYVDKSGNPILDEQGREQYKINIFSAKSIETDCKKIYEWEKGSIRQNGELHDLEDRIRTKDYINVKNLKHISLKFNTDLNNKEASISINMYNKNKESLGDFDWDYGSFEEGFSLKHSTEYIKIKIYGGENSGITPDNLLDCKLYFEDCQNRYEELLILPVKLLRVGNTADKLYWDNNKGRYLIEKNIDSTHIEISAYRDSILRDSNLENDETNKFYISNFFANKGFKAYDVLSTGIVSVSFDEMQDVANTNVCISNSTVGSFNIRVPKSIDDIEKLIDYISGFNIIAYLPLKKPEIISTNLTSKLIIPTYEDRTYIYAETKNGVNPTLKVTVDRMNRIAQDSIVEVETNPTVENISLSRSIVNQMEESLLKDQLQEKLNSIFALEDMVIEKQIASVNTDVYIKSLNALSLSLSTNSITFDNFGSVENQEMNSAVKLSVESSLPYELNACLPQEIRGKETNGVLNPNIVNLKLSTQDSYTPFSDIDTKLHLLDNQTYNNNNTHSIDIMLDSGIMHKKDVYRGIIKFEVNQK